MTFGAEIWGPPLVAAAVSTAGGLLNKGGNKETKQQRTSRKTADELLASIKGEGPFSGLFQTDENAFNKSFVEPAQAKFRNQIAHQIQQQYIAGGQQRGTGLDDQLLRAGVDLDQLLNENFLKFQQGGQDRTLNALNSIIGMGPGAAKPMSTGEAFGQGISGFLASDPFQTFTKDIFKDSPQQQQQQSPFPMPNQGSPPPKGFARDWQNWNSAPLGDQRWSQ